MLSDKRPNLGGLFAKVGEHYATNHNTHYNNDRRGCALFCCGPDALVSSAQKAAGLVSTVSGMPFDLHKEVFEF